MSNTLHTDFPIQPFLSGTDSANGAGYTFAEQSFAFKNVELIDRLHTLRDTFGFMPTSQGEINEAFNLLSYIGHAGGAAKHLNDILRHQTSTNSKVVNTLDPQAAVRSVASEYAAYAQKARSDSFALRSLREVTHGAGQSNLSSLRHVDLRDGIPQMVRYYDLRKLIDTHATPVNPFLVKKDGRRSPLDPYTTPEPSRDMQTHIQAVVDSTRLWQVQAEVDAMITDQESRKAFWVERLQEARQHSVASPIAYAALQGLGVQISA